VTYDQYKTILAALEANKQAAQSIQDRRPLSATALFRERQADEAIATLRTAFDQSPSVVLVRGN
jgi:hypothetical protein